MAAEPPPFDFPEEGEGQKEGAGEEDEGLFSDPVAPPSQAEEEVHEVSEQPWPYPPTVGQRVCLVYMLTR